jgi:hypothetical protein
MNLMIWINGVFGVLATVYGVVVVRGVLRGSLRAKWPTRFLACTLLECLAGLLPLARHLAPIQDICMLTVYCSAAAIAAWLRFHLFGLWRSVFVVSVTTVLYLDFVTGSIQLFRVVRLFTSAVEGPFPAFPVLQFALAAVFAVLGVLAVRRCQAEPTRSF